MRAKAASHLDICHTCQLLGVITCNKEALHSYQSANLYLMSNLMSETLKGQVIFILQNGATV